MKMKKLYTSIGVILPLLLSSPSINSFVPSLSSLSIETPDKNYLDVAALITHAKKIREDGFASYIAANGNIHFFLTEIEDIQEIWQRTEFSITQQVDKRFIQHSTARLYHQDNDKHFQDHADFAYLDNIKVYHIDSGISSHHMQRIVNTTISVKTSLP